MLLARRDICFRLNANPYYPPTNGDGVRTGPNDDDCQAHRRRRGQITPALPSVIFRKVSQPRGPQAVLADTMNYVWVVTTALALGFISSVFGLERSFAVKTWSQSYLTQNTTDVAVSLSLDAGNGYMFIVGRATGPRGKQTSFQGLVYNIATRTEFPSTNTSHRDGIIAKISKHDGRIMWATRLSSEFPTRLSSVAISPDRALVYATGVLVKSPGNHPFIVKVFSTENGSPRGDLYISDTTGISHVGSTVAHSDGVYICGRSSAENGPSFESEPGSMGGVIVASISTSGKQMWLKQAGNSLESDFCSGLSVSVDETALFVASTQQKPTSSVLRLARSVVYRLSVDEGNVIWKTQLPSTETSEFRSLDVIARKDAVFVSTSFWSDSTSARKIYIHKLSTPRGTFLWSKETCCSASAIEDFTSTEFNGKDAAEPVSGILYGADRYIYHIGYFRLRKGFVDNRYATVMLRVGEYGEHTPLNDSSLPIDTFKIIPSEPLQAALSYDDRSMFVLSNAVNTSSEDVDAARPRLSAIKFKSSEMVVAPRKTWGKYYLKFSIELLLSSVSIGSVHDLLAERLRISYNQTSFSSSPSRDISSVHMAVIRMTLFSDRFSGSFGNAEKEVQAMFARSGGSDKNHFESHFGLKRNSVVLVNNSTGDVQTGLSSSIVGSAGGDEVGSSNGSVGYRDPSLNGIDWKRIAFSIAGLVSFMAAVAGFLAVARYRSERGEESFSSPLRRTANSDNGSIVYYNVTREE